MSKLGGKVAITGTASGIGHGNSAKAMSASLHCLDSLVCRLSSKPSPFPQDWCRDPAAEDIAKAALFFASDSTFINGHALVVEGGLTHGRRW